MIKFGKPIVGSQETEAIGSVIDSGIFVHGQQTALFEQRFCEVFDYPFAVSVANCTAGLHLAHHSLSKNIDSKIKKAKNVICPAMTHVATAHVIELAGLTPKFVDCNSVDGNIDVDLLDAEIDENTVGIAAMHFNGIPCDIGRICDIATARGLYVVEDCAISLGAKVNGIPVGLFGDAGAFSFHPVKQLTTGEGGMVVMRNEVLRDSLKLERAFGVNRSFSERKIDGQYGVEELGFNYRMAEIPAAMGVAQLEKHPTFAETRLENFKFLADAFDSIDELTVTGRQILSDRSYYCLIACISDDANLDRNELAKALKEQGVQTSIYYPHPVPRLGYYAKRYGYDADKYPNATRISDRSIAFPIAPHLNREDMAKIVHILKGVL